MNVLDRRREVGLGLLGAGVRTGRHIFEPQHLCVRLFQFGFERGLLGFEVADTLVKDSSMTRANGVRPSTIITFVHRAAPLQYPSQEPPCFGGLLQRTVKPASVVTGLAQISPARDFIA